jgi:hypothetical protein
MGSRIDILKNDDTIVSTIYETQERKFFVISELSQKELKSYNALNDLSQEKFGDNEQLFLSDSPIKRLVKIYDFKLDNKGFEEFLYDDLSASEKTVFDDFCNAFIS